MGTECMRTKRQKRGLLEQNLQAWPQGPAPLTPIPTPQCPNPKEMPPIVSAKTREAVQTRGQGGSLKKEHRHGLQVLKRAG